MPFDAARDRLAQSIALERLGQIVDDALAQALDRRPDVVVAGRDDDRGLGVFAAQLIGQPQAVVAGHPQVAERHRHRRRGQQLERRVGTGRDGDEVAA